MTAAAKAAVTRSFEKSALPIKAARNTNVAGKIVFDQCNGEPSKYAISLFFKVGASAVVATALYTS